MEIKFTGAFEEIKKEIEAFLGEPVKKAEEDIQPTVEAPSTQPKTEKAAEESTKGYNAAEVKQLAAQLVKAKRGAAVKQILNQIGVARVGEIPEDKLEEAGTLLKGAIENA